MEKLGHKESGIYMIINLLNNKCYVGSSTNINRRKRQHIKALRDNKHENTHLQRAVNKYGKDNFSFIILERYVPTDKLLEREVYWINTKKALVEGYNQSVPQRTDNVYAKRELRDRIGLSLFRYHYGADKTMEEYIEYSIIGKLKGITESKIIMLNLNGEFKQEFDSIANASKCTGIKYERIQDIVAGRRKRYKDFLFIRKSEYCENNDNSYKRKKFKWADSKKNLPKPLLVNPKELIGVERQILWVTIDAKKIIDVFDSVPEVSENFGYSESSLYRVLNGTYTHINGDRFEYRKNYEILNV